MMTRKQLPYALLLILMGGGCAVISSHTDSSARYVQCQSALFAREEIRAQAAAGTVLPRQDELWPVGWRVEILIRPLDGSDVVWTVSLGETGRFEIKGLRRGRYCLKASALGYEGLIAPLTSIHMPIPSASSFGWGWVFNRLSPAPRLGPTPPSPRRASH